MGEEAFLITYKDYLEEFKGHASDLVIKHNSKVIELKTEEYKITKKFNKERKESPNIFFEKHCVYPTKTNPGGPWQALEKGSDIFVCFYPRNGFFFWFDDIPFLIKRIDEIVIAKKIPLKKVWNPKHYAEGWPVPVKDIQNYGMKYKIGDDTPFKGR